MKQSAKEFIWDLLKEHQCAGLKITHNNIRCQCPLHRPNEKIVKSITFSVSFTEEDKGFPFRCFSCGKVGNIYQLIMSLVKCSYKRAEKIFLRKVTISPITVAYLQEQMKLMYRPEIKSFKEIELPESYSPKPMIKYLKWRNDNEQHNIMDIPYIISRYELYYCDGGRYAKRIIMPIKDWHGRVVYFTNRSIYHDSEVKNLFPFASDAMNFVYGLYEAMISGAKKAFICEGPFETYQLMSFIRKETIKGWASVSLMGTEMTEERAAQISSIFDEAYILLDNEKETFKKDPKTKMNKEEKVYNILSDFMKTYKITNLLYPGKEPATSNKKQLRKLFEFKPEKRLALVDKITGW